LFERKHLLYRIYQFDDKSLINKNINLQKIADYYYTHYYAFVWHCLISEIRTNASLLSDTSMAPTKIINKSRETNKFDFYFCYLLFLLFTTSIKLSSRSIFFGLLVDLFELIIMNFVFDQFKKSLLWFI